jgi:hypothetical protein
MHTFLYLLLSQINVEFFLERLKSSDGSCPPVKFDVITHEHFLLWICTLKNTRNESQLLSFSHFNTQRSAFFNLFRDFHQQMPKKMEDELSQHFRGLKRKIATDTSKGAMKVTVGKDPLDFPAYIWLCDKLLCSEDSSGDFIFAHTLLTMCWNLMCRISNGTSYH